jgi:hypothetical protein
MSLSDIKFSKIMDNEISYISSDKDSKLLIPVNVINCVTIGYYCYLLIDEKSMKQIHLIDQIVSNFCKKIMDGIFIPLENNVIQTHHNKIKINFEINNDHISVKFDDFNNKSIEIYPNYIRKTDGECFLHYNVL